jgi:serine/threonine-protein kinase BUR1
VYEASHELDKRGRRPPAATVQPPPGQRPPAGQMPPNGVNSGFPGFYPRDRPGQHGPPPLGGQSKALPPINGFNPYLAPPYAGPPPGFMPGPMLPVQPPPQQYNRGYLPPPGPYGLPPPGFSYQPPPPPTSTLTQNRPAHLPPRPPGPLPPGTGRSGKQRDHRQGPGQPNPNASGGLNYG